MAYNGNRTGWKIMKTSTEELKRLAEAATPGQWRIRPYIPGIDCGVDGMFQVCHHASARDAAYIAAANPAAMLELIRQRDELLASLKEARELVEDWGAYAPAYMQEKHDLEGDMNKLDAAIARAEAP
jgi:hypothetical protein